MVGVNNFAWFVDVVVAVPATLVTCSGETDAPVKTLMSVVKTTEAVAKSATTRRAPTPAAAVAALSSLTATAAPLAVFRNPANSTMAVVTT